MPDINNVSKQRGSFLFWQRWLFYTSLLFALFGIALVLYGNNPLFTPYIQALARLFWHQQNIPTEFEPFLFFICGPLGATIACSYILLAYLSWYPFKRYLINGFSILQKALPLLFTWKDFKNN
ncbi:MAG: hypothetical protein K8R85_01925 [Bacteroidetes bacterium]|nr:hypothetical protein [Bacteroidota bacterium]